MMTLTPPPMQRERALLIAFVALMFAGGLACAAASIPSFPGAEGAGAVTRGGRGGRVIEVTTLADRGPGSFRAAVEAAGPRVVVFRISGLITLETPVAINHPYLTIAGQTASGDGICIRGATTTINAPEVIIRHLRFRHGNLTMRDDALNAVHSPGRIIIDHCSFSWGLDENVSIYRYMKPGPDGTAQKLPIENVTIQWSMSSEALDLNNHAFGATWGGRNVSFHHNLFASNTARNPSIGWGDHVDFRNNVVFNWRHRTIDGGDSTSMINIVANTFKAGPAAQEGALQHRIARPEVFRNFNERTEPGRWHVTGNDVVGYPHISADNWAGGVQFGKGPNGTDAQALLAQGRAAPPVPAEPITQHTAPAAWDLVLAGAGATMPRRDPVDERIIGEVRSGRPTYGNGIIRTPADVGGWPDYRSIPAPVDTDHDGMPDAWELRHGFDPGNPADGVGDPDKDGYTSLEEFLNGTDPRAFVEYPHASQDEGFAVLKAEGLARHVAFFNAMEDETVVNLVPNAEALAWLAPIMPRFESSDAEVEQIYHFRWWALRKHLKRDPATGLFTFTEFINKERTISSALGHNLMEGRWLRDPRFHDEWVRYWLRGKDGKPQDHLHKYSQWLAHALHQRFLVTDDRAGLVALLDDLVADYRNWEQEKRLESGLYWQHDVWDAMEESISGSRRDKNIRPTINSYMYGNARAIAEVSRLAERDELAAEFAAKAAEIRRLTLEHLWDDEAKFFKVRHEKGPLADVREAIGFLPWYFGLPERDHGYEAAWAQLTDPEGFWAPLGLTTAERRHPEFRSHGIGTCEWDGALWPFATSQTLTALGNVLREYPQEHVARRDYFDAFITYVRSQHYDGLPYIGEYQDEVTGQWLKGRDPRSRWYNHSTFADLLINGIVGLRPRADDVLEVDPLLPVGAWRWFCLDGVRYHGRDVTVLWDSDGTRYGRGAGLHVLVNGREIAKADGLTCLEARLP